MCIQDNVWKGSKPLHKGQSLKWKKTYVQCIEDSIWNGRKPKYKGHK